MERNHQPCWYSKDVVFLSEHRVLWFSSSSFFYYLPSTLHFILFSPLYWRWGRFVGWCSLLGRWCSYLWSGSLTFKFFRRFSFLLFWKKRIYIYERYISCFFFPFGLSYFSLSLSLSPLCPAFPLFLFYGPHCSQQHISLAWVPFRRDVNAWCSAPTSLICSFISIFFFSFYTLPCMSSHYHCMLYWVLTWPFFIIIPLMLL